MKELVEVVAKALVDNPDEVVVTEKTEGKNIEDIKCICRNNYCGYCNLSYTYDCYSTAD